MNQTLLQKWRRDSAYRAAFPCSAAKRWADNRHMFSYQEPDIPAARVARKSFGARRGKSLLRWKETYRIVRKARNKTFDVPTDIEIALRCMELQQEYGNEY